MLFFGNLFVSFLMSKMLLKVSSLIRVFLNAFGVCSLRERRSIRKRMRLKRWDWIRRNIMAIVVRVLSVSVVIVSRIFCCFLTIVFLIARTVFF